MKLIGHLSEDLFYDSKTLCLLGLYWSRSFVSVEKGLTEKTGASEMAEAQAACAALCLCLLLAGIFAILGYSTSLFLCARSSAG